MTSRCWAALIAVALNLTAMHVSAQTGGAPLSERGMGVSDAAAARAAESTRAFEAMDRNGDGMISRPEARGAVAASFVELDVSKDDRIDYAEFVLMKDDGSAHTPGPSEGPAPIP